jgi:conjugative transposon TraM protein
MKAYTSNFLRKRKLMTVFPVIILPFITLLFWAGGGGTGNAAPTDSIRKTGMNTELPDARLKETATDKLSLYQQALKDSLALAEEKRADPYANWEAAEDTMSEADLAGLPEDWPQTSNDPYHLNNSGRGNNEQKVRQRLADLQRTLKEEPALQQPAAQPNHSEELARLEHLMQQMQQTNSSNDAETDPELTQLNGMLEKIIDIQHPDRAKEKLRQQSATNKGIVYPVTTQAPEIKADLLHPVELPSGTNDNSFFEEISNASIQSDNEAIPVVVHETQTLVMGATIKLRLLQDVYINGVMLPKGNFIFGTCAIEGERLTATIKNFRYNNALFPVNLTAFDMDGIEGIRIPGAITRDVTKQGLDQTIQGLELYNMDPSIAAQAASAGVATAKSLLSKKTKLIKATVRAGYPLLLMDINKRNQ